MNRTVLVIGLVISVLLVGLLFIGLGKDPHRLDQVLVGRQAPSFTLRPVGGTAPLSIESMRGKPVVLNFWATWCVPCFEEHGTLTRGAEMYGKDVQFLGVVFEDEEPKIARFLVQNGQAYPTLMDLGGKTSIAYGVGGVPETFFIDAGGKVVAKYEGPLSDQLLASYVQKISGGVQ